MTGAAWIEERLGQSRRAQRAHIIVVVFALVSVTGFLANTFKGIGKFAAASLPWDLSPDVYAVTPRAGRSGRMLGTIGGWR